MDAAPQASIFAASHWIAVSQILTALVVAPGIEGTKKSSEQSIKFLLV